MSRHVCRRRRRPVEEEGTEERGEGRTVFGHIGDEVDDLLTEGQGWAGEVGLGVRLKFNGS